MIFSKFKAFPSPQNATLTIIAISLILVGFVLHHLSEPTIESISSLSHLRDNTSSSVPPGKFLADSQFQSKLNSKEIVNLTIYLKVKRNPFSTISKIQILQGPVEFIKGLKVIKGDGKRYLVEIVDSEIIFKLNSNSSDLISVDFTPTLKNPFNLLSQVLLTIGFSILIFFFFNQAFHRIAIFIFVFFVISNFTTKHYLEFQSDTLGHFDAISMNKLFPSYNECDYCQHLPLGYLPFKALFKEKQFYQNKDFNGLRFLSAIIFLTGFLFILKALSIELSSLNPTHNRLYFLTFLFHPFYLFNNFQLSNDSVLYLFSFLTIYFLVKYKKINFILLLTGTLVKLNYLILYPFIFFRASSKKKTFIMLAISLSVLITVNVVKDLPAVGVSDVFNTGTEAAKLNHTIKTFFNIPTFNEIKNPFLTAESFDSTWIYLVKTSLFVELTSFRIDNLGHLIGMNLLGAVIAFVTFNIFLLTYHFKNLKKLFNSNEILIASSIAAIVYAVLTIGFETIQSFRHISFVLFPLFVFSSKITQLSDKLKNLTTFLLLYFLAAEIGWAIYFMSSDIYNYF